jgi:endonuclease YncB( thermonuclease family)
MKFRLHHQKTLPVRTTRHRRYDKRSIGRWNFLIPLVGIALIASAGLLHGVDADSPVSSSKSRIVGVASVVDGDTIDFRGTRVRFFGIDAPESSQTCTDPNGQTWRCGQRAALALSSHIGRSTVSCHPRDRDRYGRTVAICFLGDEDLNGWMVSEGYAVAYRHYSLVYLPRELVARANDKNIWNGSFDWPWDWRSTHRRR